MDKIAHLIIGFLFVVTTSATAIPKQCTSYNELNAATRVCGAPANFSDGHPSPDWKGSGYYRFVPPAGTRLSSELTGRVQSVENGCEAIFGVSPDSYLPTKYYEEKQMSYVWCYFSNGYAEDMSHTFAITATKCPGDFYVYYLPNTDDEGTSERYCSDL